MNRRLIVSGVGSVANNESGRTVIPKRRMITRREAAWMDSRTRPKLVRDFMLVIDPTLARESMLVRDPKLIQESILTIQQILKDQIEWHARRDKQ